MDWPFRAVLICSPSSISTMLASLDKQSIICHYEICKPFHFLMHKIKSNLNLSNVFWIQVPSLVGCQEILLLTKPKNYNPSTGKYILVSIKNKYGSNQFQYTWWDSTDGKAADFGVGRSRVQISTGDDFFQLIIEISFFVDFVQDWQGGLEQLYRM